MERKAVVILGWETLPTNLKEWFKEYHGSDSRTNTFYKLDTELPVSTLRDINLMREHMVSSWKMDEKELETDVQLLEYLSDHGDNGAFIYRVLQRNPDFELTDETMILLDGNW